MRHDGRKETMLRPVKIQTNVYKHPEGSVVISFGDTTVICSATIEDRVPPFLRDTGKGWVSLYLTVCFSMVATFLPRFSWRPSYGIVCFLRSAQTLGKPN